VKTVYAQFSWASLLLLRPRVRELHMRDFVLDLQYDMDSGSWNVGDLRFANNMAASGKQSIPTLYLRGGKLRYSKVSGGESTTVCSLPIEAQFGPHDSSTGDYAFEITTSTLSGGYGDSTLKGKWRPGRFEVAGGLSSTDIPSLERAWAVDVLAADMTYDETGKYQLTVRLKDVHSKLTPEVDAFRMVAPPILGPSNPLSEVQQFFARYQPYGVVSAIDLSANGNLNAIDSSSVTGVVTCKDISVCDRTFPYQIDHLTGSIVFTQSLIQLNRLFGRHAETKLVIDGWTRGSGKDQEYAYEVTSDNMVLDEKLYAALQPGPKQMWEAFSPRGVVGVNYRMSRTSPSDRTNLLVVDLRDVSATYARFPYPLSALTGKLIIDHDDITVSNVAAENAGGRIVLNGKVVASDISKPSATSWWMPMTFP
jgi:hypothetical protein